MSRELAENDTSSPNNEEESGEPAAIPHQNDYNSDQEETYPRPIGSNLQVLMPRNVVPAEESEDYSPINREITNEIQLDTFMDLIISDYFSEQGGNSILAENGIRIKEDFEGILVIGDTIIVIDKDLGESS